MNNFDFLPEDYVAPKTSSQYMKLQDGENKIRILSKPIMGWEDWLDKKPVRSKMDKKPSKSIDPSKPLKHFWCFIVWNYLEERIQILHVTQAGIRKALENYCKDEDWGAPYFYDIKIVKKGEGKETEYSVMPLPHKPVKDEVKQKYKDRPCNLEAVFVNMDPFADGYDSYTPGIFCEEDIQRYSNKVQPINQDKITPQQAAELVTLLQSCTDKYQSSVNNFLDKQKISITDLPLDTYKNIKNRAIKEIEETI